MKIETIRKSHKKKVIIGIVAFIVIAIVFIVGQSFAKYSLVKSIKIAEGTINYKIPDFKIMAMYQQKANQTCTNDSCYEEITSKRMPSSGYVINESKSYCSLDNINKDKDARLYTNQNGEHIISNLAKSSKCYLYFDKAPTANEKILSNITVKSGTPDFNKTAQITCSDATTCETTNGVYKAKDDDGDTYYFRGYVENNYVRFAGYWWRIIRINGDGSIRLIYDGTSAHANGTNTTDSIAVEKVKWSHKDAYWNSSTDNAYTKDNMYVGFKYTSGQVHGLGTKSNALIELESWYKSNLLSYTTKLDTNAGFCGDRTPSTSNTTSNGLGGTGTTTTYYDEYIRLLINKSPVLTCVNSSDLYTTNNSSKGNKSLTNPVGLITADEVAMAGGLIYIQNQNFYLYNGQGYMVLSPFAFNGGQDIVMAFSTTGYLGHNGVYFSRGNFRPVINLRSNIGLSGTGTISDPYIVK